jgi:hypothetical protein
VPVSGSGSDQRVPACVGGLHERVGRATRDPSPAYRTRTRYRPRPRGPRAASRVPAFGCGLRLLCDLSVDVSAPGKGVSTVQAGQAVVDIMKERGKA